MDTIEMQIGNFLNKCDDLLQAKFILAPSKISDLLRGLATVPALISWLQRATASFDYLKAQELYLRPSRPPISFRTAPFPFYRKRIKLLICSWKFRL